MIETQPRYTATEPGNNGSPQPKPGTGWDAPSEDEKREIQALAHAIRCESVHPIIFDREDIGNAFSPVSSEIIEAAKAKYENGQTIESAEQATAAVRHHHQYNRDLPELTSEGVGAVQRVADLCFAEVVGDETESRETLYHFFRGTVVGRILKNSTDVSAFSPEMTAEKITGWVALSDEIRDGAGSGNRIEIKSFGENWNAHEAKLNQTRGRQLLGLKTGVDELDRRLFGLQGFTLLGAMPGVGKTALTLQIGRGPRFFKAGSRVWYLVSELDRWIESRSTNCSSSLPADD